jgi:hypothetical protein
MRDPDEAPLAGKPSELGGQGEIRQSILSLPILLLLTLYVLFYFLILNRKNENQIFSIHFDPLSDFIIQLVKHDRQTFPLSIQPPLTYLVHYEILLILLVSC